MAPTTRPNAATTFPYLRPGAFCLTRRFVLLLLFCAFIALCVGAIFFLMDSSKLLSIVVFHHLPSEHRVGGGEEEVVAGGGESRQDAAAENLAEIWEDNERALWETKR